MNFTLIWSQPWFKKTVLTHFENNLDFKAIWTFHNVSPASFEKSVNNIKICRTRSKFLFIHFLQKFFRSVRNFCRLFSTKTFFYASEFSHLFSSKIVWQVRNFSHLFSTKISLRRPKCFHLFSTKIFVTRQNFLIYFFQRFSGVSKIVHIYFLPKFFQGVRK